MTQDGRFSITEEQYQLLEDAEDLYQNAPSGYFSFDTRENIFRVNKTLLNWLQYEEHEATSMKFSDLLTIGGKIYFQNHYYPLLMMQGFVTEVTFDLVRKDRTIIPALINSVAKRDVSGNIKSFRATVIDISDRRKYERQLLTEKREAESAKKRFQLITEMLPEIVWTFTEDGNIDFINEQIITYTGKLPSKKITAFREIIHPDDYFICLIKWVRAIKSHSLFEYELRLKNHADKYQWFVIRAIPYADQAQGNAKWLGICININSQKELVVKMDEFLSIASHELKTPLTTIKAYMQLLSKDALEERMKGYVFKTNRQVDKLQSLVNDLLDVSKIQAGQMKLSLSIVDLNTIVSETVESMRTLSLTHKINLDLSPDKLKIFGDRNRLEQVIINLVNNGIKYSPDADTINVKVSCNPSFAIVSVEDFGIGITREDLGRLFDRFYRASTPFLTSGLGIGLYISRNIVKRHGGELKVESEYGKGSRFYFTIPLFNE